MQVDHPLCEECTDTLLENMEQQLELAEQDSQVYIYLIFCVFTLKVRTLLLTSMLYRYLLIKLKNLFFKRTVVPFVQLIISTIDMTSLPPL